MWQKNYHMWGWNCQMWKKVREPPNVTKEFTCEVGTAQCENETIKCEKKK